jgi:hypothetical protein
LAKVYKVHPGIGIARVGRSEQGYFLAPETTAGEPLELSDNGEVAFTGYKDNARLMRRQGVRFHIFEYEDLGGTQTLVREITAADATIEWTVKLASRKAAGVLMDDDLRDADGAGIVTPGTGVRNEPPPGFARNDLVASIELQATGNNFVPAPKPMAQFLRKAFYIGEARTDFAGRLVVLGGMGEAATWTQPPSPLVYFLNNPGWHDDISDGPVDAKITLAGTSQTIDAVGAWVVTAPPDFAPGITPITTLYDIALQAREGLIAAAVSYAMDVRPLFERFAEYRWVNDAGVGSWGLISDLLRTPAALEDKSEPNRDNRNAVLDAIREAEKLPREFRLTKRQMDCLERWAKGQFIPGDDQTRPRLNAGQELDRAALSRGVGGGFYPGIEAGLLLRERTVYSELGRLTRGPFTDFGGVTATLQPGSLTERMACPWQADFMECIGAWWPAQRPDVRRFDEDGAERTEQWDRGVRSGLPATPNNRKNMVDHFAQLGVIERMDVQGKSVFAEKGRHPALGADS